MPPTPAATPVAGLAHRPAARNFSFLDKLIAPADQALRTLFGVDAGTARPYPAQDIGETLNESAQRRQVAALMRVNHAGEVAAQALYQGQAFVASNPSTRDGLLEAGREETDHLAWCSRRIEELGGHVSVLNPLWYAGSFAIGAFAGLSGDRNSLGFVAETERQVVEHLQHHLKLLPQEDQRTRAIVTQMSTDEARHGNNAVSAGAATLPSFARGFMRLTAKVMTRSAYWV